MYFAIDASFSEEVDAISAQSKTQTKEMLSMVAAADGQSLLAEIKAVEGPYPSAGSDRASAEPVGL